MVAGKGDLRRCVMSDGISGTHNVPDPQPCNDLSPERQSIYAWAAENQWPRLVISDWETIIGGSADSWAVTCRFISPQQMERTRKALMKLDWSDGTPTDAGLTGS